MSTRWKIALFLFVILLLTMGAFTYLLLTSSGSELLTRQYVEEYMESNKVTYETVDGSLLKGLIYTNVELHDLKFLPAESVLKIQRLSINLTSFDPKDLEVKLENARLNLPKSDSIVLSGTIKNEQLDFNIFTRNISMDSLEKLFHTANLASLKGTLDDADIFLTGTLREPTIKGSIHIKKVLFKEYSLKETPLLFDVRFKSLTPEIMLTGWLRVSEGIAQIKKTEIKLIDSRINFNGDWRNPTLNLHGLFEIEKTKIKINVRGTRKTPDLKLSSEPPLPDEKLLLMLATGRSWKSLDRSLTEKALSPELTADFVDYFFFAGVGQKISDYLGISDVAVTLEKEKKGVMVKKDLNDKVEIDYGIKQSLDKQQQPVTTHIVGGELKVTDQVSVGAQKEIKQNPQPKTGESFPQETPEDNRLYMKYKLKF